jgi:gluconate 2-dehydrogenase gamma chain
MSSGTLHRRRFLQAAATTAAAGAVSCSKQGGQSAGRVLSGAELETIQAIAARIVPTDADPGATEAGVGDYIDRQLGGILKKHAKTYRQGVVGINQVSEARFGQRFAALAPAQQDEILTQIEAGRTDAKVWQPAAANAFFDLVRDHAMQGFYGDPRHGGNREYASWRMLGVPPAPIRGRRIYDLTTGVADEDRRNKPWR